MVFQSVVVGPSIARQLLAGLMQSRNENSIKQPSGNFEFAADGAAQHVIHLNLSTVRPSVRRPAHETFTQLARGNNEPSSYRSIYPGNGC